MTLTWLLRKSGLRSGRFGQQSRAFQAESIEANAELVHIDADGRKVEQYQRLTLLNAFTFLDQNVFDNAAFEMLH